MSQTVMQGQERRRAETLLDGQKRVLEMINGDAPLSRTLDEICRVVESQAEGMMASILLLDEEGKHLLHGGAPSLPEGYCKAIHGVAIGPTIGSCGAAAYSGEPCIVEDITTHPNWAPFKALAYDTYGLGSCWSYPIRAYDGKVIATFAVYHKVPKKPTPKEQRVIEFAEHLAAIALNRHRELERLKAAA